MAPRKWPCKVCHRWFEPHPRAGNRQRVCSEPACQQERHRRADRACHRRHPDYDRKRRLKERLGDEPEVEAYDEPLVQLDWEAAEKAIGPAHRVVAERAARLLVAWAKDAVPPRMAGEGRQPDPLASSAAQDAVSTRRTLEPAQQRRLPRGGRETQSDGGGRGP